MRGFYGCEMIVLMTRLSSASVFRKYHVLRITTGDIRNETRQLHVRSAHVVFLDEAVGSGSFRGIIMLTV